MDSMFHVVRPNLPCLQFVFAAMDVIEVPHVVDHVARFLPSIRDSVSS
jgi:hypothetical protein